MPAHRRRDKGGRPDELPPATANDLREAGEQAR